MADLLVQEGLTKLTPDGRVVPALAESWQWENGGRKLRVFLRPDVHFHDETPLTAAVAVQALQAVISRQASLYPALNDIVEVRPDGDLQLVVELSRPSAFLPEDLSVALRLRDTRTGTGPFRIVEETTSEVVLESFKQYYLGVPSIDRVIIRPFDTLRTTWSSFLRGEVDMVNDVPQDTVEFIRNDDVEVISFTRWYQFVVAYNSRRQPFTSPLVRRALNSAIDRDEIIRKHLQGSAIPATGPIWLRHWAYDTSVPSYSFDPGYATSLLDSAGFHIGTAPAVPGRPGNMRLRFTCLIPPNFSIWEKVAIELQRQLYDIGVDMQFEVVPYAEYDRRLRTGEFDAAFADLISGPTLGRPYIFWASQKAMKGLNVFGYENPRVESSFDALRLSTNEAATRTAARRLQREMTDDPPALFLTWSQRARAVKRSFGIINEPDRDPFPTLWRWTPAGSPRQSSEP